MAGAEGERGGGEPLREVHRRGEQGPPAGLAQGAARHGGLPPVRVAVKALDGITCIRLDATVVHAHSDKELAEPNFKGFGHHSLIDALRQHGRAAGLDAARPAQPAANTAADHL